MGIREGMFFPSTYLYNIERVKGRRVKDVEKGVT